MPLAERTCEGMQGRLSPDSAPSREPSSSRIPLALLIAHPTHRNGLLGGHRPGLEASTSERSLHVAAWAGVWTEGDLEGQGEKRDRQRRANGKGRSLGYVPNSCTAGSAAAVNPAAAGVCHHASASRLCSFSSLRHITRNY